MPVQHPAGPAVLKVSFPHPGNFGEADAQRTFAGRGAVRLLEVDDTGLVMVLERALPQTLADHVAQNECSVEEAIEIAGDLARGLAVLPGPNITPLAETTLGLGLNSSTNRSPRIPTLCLDGHWTKLSRRSSILLPTRQQRCCTATCTTGTSCAATAILVDHRPEGVVRNRGVRRFHRGRRGRDQLRIGDGLHAAIMRRVRRFAAAARVDLDLAMACCQARAVSSYLDQLTIPRVWFDAEFLKVIALGSTDQ